MLSSKLLIVLFALVLLIQDVSAKSYGGDSYSGGEKPVDNSYGSQGDYSNPAPVDSYQGKEDTYTTQAPKEDTYATQAPKEDVYTTSAPKEPYNEKPAATPYPSTYATPAPTKNGSPSPGYESENGKGDGYNNGEYGNIPTDATVGQYASPAPVDAYNTVAPGTEPPAYKSNLASASSTTFLSAGVALIALVGALYQ